MARITIHAVHTDGEPRRWTLSERIVAENLDSQYYKTQLLERISWATADAEALESPTPDLDADHHEHELVDAAWPCAWSHEAMRLSPNA